MAYITFSLMIVALMMGCASPHSPQRGAIHYINIGESVSPKALRAKVGDEVRWVNLGQQTVRLQIIGNMKTVGCQRGFGALTSSKMVSARIASHDYASLCLGDAGEVKFQIQRENDESKPMEQRVITEPI